MGPPAMDSIMERAGWTVPGLLSVRSADCQNDTALWQLASGEQWVASSWADYRQAVASLASGFRKLGLAPGDRVAILAASCQEWDYAQLAILAAGGVAVGLDPYGLDEHTQEIARRCDFSGVVLQNPRLLEKLGDEARGKLRFAVSIEPSAELGVVGLAGLISEDVQGDSWNQAQADDVAMIIFTSGTTGAPKGIEYSHRQICLAVAAILSAFPDLAEGSRLACWLPLSNLFQRIINICAIGRGAQTFYLADPRQIMRFVSSIAPDVFIGVPRFYEKLYAGIAQAMASKPAWQRALARWALGVGERHACVRRAGLPCGLRLKLQRALAERLVLRKLRAILGPRLRFMISGSAPMPVWLLERFHAIGLLVLEAYGLSENIIPVALNRPDQFRFGSVGLPLPGCELRLADDGELLVRGPGVCRAYFGEESGEVPVDGEGYLASGDFATIDGDGYVTLTGRKSEIFKTSTGRRVAPALIESLLRQLPQVDYAAVFGAGRAQPTALLVISEAAWQGDRQQFCQRFRREAKRALAPLPAYLHPAGAALTTRLFTIAGGELTANLKMRRPTIEANFADVLDELCLHLDHSDGAPFEVCGEENPLGGKSKDGQVLLLSL